MRFTIRNLFYANTSWGFDTKLKIMDNKYKIIYYGIFENMPEEIRSMIVSWFDENTVKCE